jgi:amino acid permease
MFLIDLILMQAVFLGCSFLIAITLSDLGVMLAVVGATGSTLVSYILPGLIYSVMHAEDYEKNWEYYASITLLVVGVAIIPICLTFIFF